MRVKFSLNGREKLRTLLSLVQLLSKHGNTLYFVFKSGKITFFKN